MWAAEPSLPPSLHQGRGTTLSRNILDTLLPFPSLQVSNGNLLAILNRHYQDLTCLCFTDDSSHFLSGAKDCLALVWNLYK